MPVFQSLYNLFCSEIATDDNGFKWHVQVSYGATDVIGTVICWQKALWRNIQSNGNIVYVNLRFGDQIHTQNKYIDIYDHIYITQYKDN